MFLLIACTLSIINSKTLAELQSEWPIHDTLILTWLAILMLAYGAWNAAINNFKKKGYLWAVACGSSVEAYDDWDDAQTDPAEEELTNNPIHQILSAETDYDSKRDNEAARLRQQLHQQKQLLVQKTKEVAMLQAAATEIKWQAKQDEERQGRQQRLAKLVSGSGEEASQSRLPGSRAQSVVPRPGTAGARLLKLTDIDGLAPEHAAAIELQAAHLAALEGAPRTRRRGAGKAAGVLRTQGGATGFRAAAQRGGDGVEAFEVEPPTSARGGGPRPPPRPEAQAVELARIEGPPGRDGSRKQADNSRTHEQRPSGRQALARPKPKRDRSGAAQTGTAAVRPSPGLPFNVPLKTKGVYNTIFRIR